MSEPKKCSMTGPPPPDPADEPDDVLPPALGREAILGAQDLAISPVPVPEWGGTVYVRVLSGVDRDWFEATVAAGDGKRKNLANFRARFAALVICDADGKRLFTAQDAAALGQKSCAALDRVFERGSELNRMRPEDIEELTKNSSGDLSDGSGSPSPAS